MREPKRSTEPIWWSLFAAGGVVAALFAPVHILLTGIIATAIRTSSDPAVPAGLAADAFAFDRIAALVSHPLSRLYLFVVIALPLFHWAHRFRFTLIDLGLKGARSAVAIACYGTAIAGAILTAVVLIRL